jgi:hypothetical protein
MEGSGWYYKTNLLPLLFHGLEASQERRRAVITESRNINNEAKKMNVRLEESNTGLRCVHVDGEHSTGDPS